MKIQNQLIALLLIAFLFGCDFKKAEKSNIADPLKAEINDSINWDDKFQGSFIYHFMTDEEFQKERTSQEVKELNFVNYFAAKDYTLHIFPSFRSNHEKDLIEDVDNQNLLSVVEKEELKTFTFSKDNKKWYLQSLIRSTFIQDSTKEFLSFLYKFSKDTSYRNSHIKLPLKLTYLDMDDLEDTTEFLTIQNLSDFNYDFFKDKYFYFFHSGLEKIENSEKICLLFRGIDNGIFVMYYFERKDDTWHLVEEADYST